MVATEKNGWIKLHRKMLDNPIIMKDADHLAVWMYLLLNATHAEYPALFKGQKITLQPGQLITGRKSIAVKLMISESKVTRILNAFENEHQIEQQTSNKNRLVSIVNWDLYQSIEQQIELQMNNNRTTSEQQVNTNKNVKNNKKDKNVINNYSENPALNDAILEFVKYRKGIKKPMTDRAVSLMISKLDKMTSDVNEQIEIINQSILNGWQGIFPLNKQNNQKTRKEIVPSWMNKPKKPGFNDFQQNQYDFEALENDLVANGTKTAGNDADVKARAEALRKKLGGA